MKFKAGDLVRSSTDSSLLEILDVYQGRFTTEYKVSRTFRGRIFVSYVVASDIDSEFEIDSLGMQFVYNS